MKDVRLHSRLADMKFEGPRRIRLQYIYPKLSKPIIDQIDRVLAQHSGFTDGGLDFIINYDIKYRMGLGSQAGEEE